MNRCLAVLACGIMLGATAGPAAAAAIAESSLIWVYQFENPTPGSPSNFTTTAPGVSRVFDSDFGSDIQARGSLATGMTGTRVAITAPASQNGQSLITLFDTLTFSTPGSVPTEVSYELAVDGFLSNSVATGFAGANYGASVSIFDITGLATWLESFGSGFGFRIGASTDALLVSEVAIGLSLGTDDFIEGFAPFFDEVVADSSGIPFGFALDTAGTFTADPSKTYGIGIRGSSNATGVASSDFLATSAFRFTDLGGATFSSGSGVFLSGQEVAVPEPASIALLGAGWAVLGVFALRRQRTAPSPR